MPTVFVLFLIRRVYCSGNSVVIPTHTTQKHTHAHAHLSATFMNLAVNIVDDSLEGHCANVIGSLRN
jgi:hypothetical protein